MKKDKRNMRSYQFYDQKLIEELRSKVAEVIRNNNVQHSSDNNSGSLVRATAAKLIREMTIDAISSGTEPEWLGNESELLDQIVLQTTGLGAIETYLNDPDIENIDINGCREVWLTYYDGTKEKGQPVASSDEELIEIIRRAAARLGLSERRFDSAVPQLDLRLPDGSRLSAVMGVCSSPAISVRRHRFVDISLEDEVELGMLPESLAELLSASTKAGMNILIAGRTNSGKTTLLRALINEIDASERIITIEQSLELGIDQLKDRHPDCVALEARLPNTEGEGEISMADLVRRSLRMNPDRVIVGETLGPEIVALLNAMSQGFGSLATIHSDSSLGVFSRIASYAYQSNERLPLEATNLLIVSAIDLIVYVTIKKNNLNSTFDYREGSGCKRFVSSVREIVGLEREFIVSNEIYKSKDSSSYEFIAPLSQTKQELLLSSGFKISMPLESRELF